MKCMLILIVIVLLGAGNGCVGATREKAELYLDSLIGRSAEPFKKKWSLAGSSFKASNGNTVYVYVDEENFGANPSITSVSDDDYAYDYRAAAETREGQIANFNCRTFIEVDLSGKIIKWKLEGKSCYSYVDK